MRDILSQISLLFDFQRENIDYSSSTVSWHMLSRNFLFLQVQQCLQLKQLLIASWDNTIESQLWAIVGAGLTVKLSLSKTI